MMLAPKAIFMSGGGMCHPSLTPGGMCSPYLAGGFAGPWHVDGKSARELCTQLKDPATDDGEDMAALRKQLDTPLVLWGWEPGHGRTAVPTPYAESPRRGRRGRVRASRARA